ncbi:hypothetical protein [Devosia sp.]|uniref:MotE family protein n=1 Tax=Devosia sp. TaxID=1871048 RepID=UPI0019DBF845|nr:hypothetical protein [Devosia sp.]MBE0581925.1 hypothetical protein [Devosia sp.]
MRIPRHMARLGIAALVLVQVFPAIAEVGATSDAVEGFELAADPTLPDADPTLIDVSPTLGAEISPSDNGGTDTRTSAEGEVAAEVDASTHVASSAAGCVIDITSALEVEGAEDAPTTSASVEQAAADDTPNGIGGDAEPECVSMVDALVTHADGSQLTAPVDGISTTEALLLTRLKERRSDLDIQEATLMLQEDLLRAAEVRLEERAALLEATANELGAALDADTAKKAEEIARLAKLFETMKPKDAAAVMAGLPDDTLVTLVKLVSTRKMAPIMAQLPPDRASALTVMLAQSP